MRPANNFQKLHLALSKILVRTTELDQRTTKLIEVQVKMHFYLLKNFNLFYWNI